MVLQTGKCGCFVLINVLGYKSALCAIRLYVQSGSDKKWHVLFDRVTPLSLTEKFRDQKIWQFCDQKLAQWPILNNSHAYPFCKTMPGTQLFSIAHCTWLQI